MYGVVICPLPITTKAEGRTSPPESMREGREKQRAKKKEKKEERKKSKKRRHRLLDSVSPSVRSSVIRLEWFGP